MSDPAIQNAHQMVPDQIEFLLPLCKQKRIAVQAGGWQGTAPAILSLYFDLVYTCEPAMDNYRRLIEGIIDDKVIPIFGILGDKRGTAGIEKHSQNNSGDYRSKQEGNIPRYMIDDLGLEACDLIWLDIQGDEYEALQGALRTIDEHSPVIGFEYAKKKTPQTHSVDKFLTGLGYKHVGTCHLDRFYVRD